MDRVVEEVRDICKMDTYGGRISVRQDFNSLTVWDVAHVPPELVERLRGARVEVLAESTSLSGFVIRITLRRDKRARVLAAWVLLAWLFYFVSSRIQAVVI